MTQLIEQIDCILEVIKNGENCEIIYLNFSKAYDKIVFFIALDKMNEMGITGKNLDLIRHWLTKR